LETVALMVEGETELAAASPDHSALVAVARVPGNWPRVVEWRCPVGSASGRGRGRAPAVGKLGPAADWHPAHGYVITRTEPTDANWTVEDQELNRLSVPSLADVRFGPDGRLWVLEDQRLRVGSIRDAPVVWTNDAAAQAAGMALTCVAPGPHGTLVGRRDGRVIDLDPTGRERAARPVTDARIHAIAVSPAGDVGVAGGARGEVKLIDLETGHVTEVPTGHRAAVNSAAWGPGFFVTGSDDRRVRLWTSAGELLASFEMSGPVRKVMVSANGESLLVHVEGEQAVRRWRLDVLFREWTALGLGVRGTDPD
jgi:WD40 repeat protein